LSLPSVLLLVLSCSLDNLVVGAMYGARGIPVPLLSNLLIAAITSGGTLVCVVAGRFVGGLLTSSLSHSIGSLGIALTGAWVLIREASDGPSGGAPSHSSLTVSGLATILEDPFIGEVTSRGRLSPRESCILGLALSLNNLPNGLAAGMAGSGLFTIVIALVMLSMATLWAGLLVGRCCLAPRFKGASGIIAGLILLGIGVSELLG